MLSFKGEGYWVKVKVAYNFSVSKLLHGFVLKFVLKQAVCSQFGSISSWINFIYNF